MSDIRKRTDRKTPDEPIGAGDYFQIVTEERNYTVSPAMADVVLQDLTADQDWTLFLEVTGSVVRLRCDTVLAVEESTAEQRARARTLQRAEYRVQRAEEPWDENYD